MEWPPSNQSCKQATLGDWQQAIAMVALQQLALLASWNRHTVATSIFAALSLGISQMKFTVPLLPYKGMSCQVDMT